MARQLGALRVQGKVANVVGYKNPASSKSNNNFVRERVYEVSNPKTMGQAYQRAKARPAQIFYTGFESVLNHAFLPKGRASRNRNKFMSYAMSLDNVSDLPKGAAYLPFAPYAISKGALGLDALVPARAAIAADGIPNGQNYVVFPNLATEGVDFAPWSIQATIADYSAVLIEDNQGLVEGMEITFLAVVANANDLYQRTARRWSFVLDTNNTVTKLVDVVDSIARPFVLASGETAIGPSSDGYVILSAGLIISAKSGNTYVYTNSNMGCSQLALDIYDQNEQLVVDSYMAEGSTTESDLILQQANNVMAGNRVVPESIAPEEIEAAAGLDGTFSSIDIGLVTMNNGDKRFVVSGANNQLMAYNSTTRVLTPVTFTPTGGSARPATLADTDFAGNGTIDAAALASLGVSIEVPAGYTVTQVKVGTETVEKGVTLGRIENETSVVVTGTGLSGDIVKLVNATTEDDTSPIDDTAVRVEFETPSESGVYQLIIGGELWTQWYYE